VALAALVLAATPAVPAAATLTAPFPALDLNLPVPPRLVPGQVVRPVAEQGQIVFRHPSRVGRLADEDVERALGSLAQGTRIRIASRDEDAALTGTYAGLGLATVRVDTPYGPMAYDRTAVRRLWVGKPQTGTGALIGGINGFVLGMLLGAVSLDSHHPEYLGRPGGFDPPPGRSDLEQFGQLCFRWGLPVGLAGAALGAVIGSFTTGWQPVSP
jgi:hypothetical protein